MGYPRAHDFSPKVAHALTRINRIFREDSFVAARREVGPRVHGANHAGLPFRQAQDPELIERLRGLCGWAPYC